MPVPIPGGEWPEFARNVFIQVTAILKTKSGHGKLQTVYVFPDESGNFSGNFDNIDGSFVEGSSDSWWRSADKIVLTLRADLLQPDHSWERDVVDYIPGEVLHVINGKFHRNTQWQAVDASFNQNAIADVQRQIQ